MDSRRTGHGGGGALQSSAGAMLADEGFGGCFPERHDDDDDG